MSSIDTTADKTARKGRKPGAGNGSGPVDAGLEDLLEALRSILARDGTMPPERTVAEELSVKRHTLRRALGVMRSLGELEPARAGRRAAPQPVAGAALINSTNPLEVMELRLVLEPALARLAALRASPAEIERIRRAASTTPGTDPNAADIAFHRAIAAGSRNSLASELYVILHRVASDGRLRYTDSDASLVPERVRMRDAEHGVIADAIAARDPDGAERAMYQHLVAIQQKIMGRLSPGSAY
ncbi:FadR/GntR family transcriptional regulator [Oharaeibacter diazotrophicus]|uniref:DNA-binding FadR family transcriptional regulator n=1 Tax=Oharaeibacter diazotrophicus TaxID=1920512 RepID=A0A4R6R7P9_9HYPH|nr:FCD domain-containing protein [Oharaeibacter diazotrophicus]TDP81912.1 DNA-binding FadR family transcriptional regulator [Oharaeibacter diazotrophicus]BBE73544.1 putative L-lactate dehydrogenase operon regulatory protein [Pleomorphomonas sp. SM30]GLS75334.1 GntR family transcriptional regulator [Oharaeibacter diazotrophicus]